MRQPTRDRLTEALFAPHVVRSYTCDVHAEFVDGLRSEELAAIEPMSANRVAEFATARACARLALADIGTDAAVPKRAGGAPEWPAGAAGSISHTRGYCVAVASHDDVSLGIDVEAIDRMSAAVERRVLVDTERRDLDTLAAADRRLRLATIFATKEAFYKAHYELDARYLGFDVLAVHCQQGSISLHPESGDVDAELIARATARVRVHEGRVIAGVSIDPTGIMTRLPSPA